MQTIFNELVSIVDPAIFVAGALFLMFFLLWLVLKPLNYWYWKIEERDRLLENMDKQLAELCHTQRRNERTVQGEEILRAISDVKAHQERETAARERQRTESCEKQTHAAEPADRTENGDLHDKPEEVNGERAQEKAIGRTKRRYSTSADAVDKNGRVHLREDIEKMIRF